MGNTASGALRARRRRLIRAPPPEPASIPYTKPSGLYSTCAWDVKLVRRLILRGDLAPRFPGLDHPSPDAREECPICMLVYPVLNETRCCAARLCTECYLQIRPPRHNKEPCPFCKYKRVDATFRGPRDVAEIDREERDEQRAAEAMRRVNAQANAPVAAASSAVSVAGLASCQPASAVGPMTAISTTSPGVGAAMDTAAATLSHTHDSIPSPLRLSPSQSCDVHVAHPLSTSPCTPASDRTVSASSVSRPTVTSKSRLVSVRQSHACTCRHAPASQLCRDDNYALFHQTEKAPAIDPLLLEAMASEVTFASPAGAAVDWASASSSGRLDLHSRDLRADRASESDAESMSYLADMGHRVVRLPWYGVDLDRLDVAGSCSAQEAGSSCVGRHAEVSSEELSQEERMSLNEAIRRSLVDL